MSDLNKLDNKLREKVLELKEIKDDIAYLKEDNLDQLNDLDDKLREKALELKEIKDDIASLEEDINQKRSELNDLEVEYENLREVYDEKWRLHNSIN